MKNDMQSDISLDDLIKSLDFSYRGIISNKYYVIISQVVCNQLGFTNGGIYEYFDEGSGLIWLDEVECTGSESSIFDCPHDGLGNSDCDHGEDAGVTCNA